MLKTYFFDGTVLIAIGTIKFRDNFEKVMCFEQTDKKREIGKEYDEPTKPDLFFIFDSIESIDSLMKACEELKKRFLKDKL